MAVKAVWHNDVAVVEEDGDVFGEDATPVKVMTVGTPIDLNASVATLDKRLCDLLTMEGDLDAIGTTCPIKDNDLTSCFACPLYEGGDPSSTLGSLCRIGREQQSVLTILAIKTHGERRV
jgi:hypothetical protein